MYNLVELAEQLTEDDIIELLARKACLYAQEFAKNQLDLEDLDPEDRESFENTLRDVDAMIDEAQSFSYQAWFDHYQLGGNVEDKINEVAEEFVR